MTFEILGRMRNVVWTLLNLALAAVFSFLSVTRLAKFHNEYLFLARALDKHNVFC